MKPTVIQSGSSENPPSTHHQSTAGNNNNVNPAGQNISAGQNIDPNMYPTNSRQFPPQFQTGFGFGNDDDVDDIFSDAGLRSRLHRMRDPFGFARKRCGNDLNGDPYSRYFEDDSDFFPSFGSMGGRRRPDDDAGFFDHIPSEFRHYIPDGFGFSHRRQPQQAAPRSGQPQQQQQVPQQHQQHQQQPQQQPQYYEAYAQPGSPTMMQPPPQQKPKLCDAAIQTENLDETDDGRMETNLKQHGLRNTVDLGQKSPPEECRSPRSQSAPPPDGNEQGPPGQNAASGDAGPNGPNSNTGAGCPPQQQQQRQGGNQQQRSQGTAPMTPLPNRQFQPQPNFQQQQPQYQQSEYQQPPQYQQQPPRPQPQGMPQKQGSLDESGFVRTVPIFVEGRKEPFVSSAKFTPQEQAPRPPQRQHPQQQYAQQPHPQQQQHPQQQPHPQQQHRPTPINTQQVPDDNQPPPQTPQTAECISKIQAIQRDVLLLMGKVEHFKGTRQDKEYMFIDEMLTRNLLKLDTIETNGKDSIRLARREAIKCIQASINVLEAKAEENSKTAQKSVIETQTDDENVVAAAAAAEAVPENVVENAASEISDDSTKKKEDEAESLPAEKIAIPLPPPESHKPAVSEPVVAAVSEEVTKATEDAGSTEKTAKVDDVKKGKPKVAKVKKEEAKPKTEESKTIEPKKEEPSKETPKTEPEAPAAQEESAKTESAPSEGATEQKAEATSESAAAKETNAPTKQSTKTIKLVKKKKAPTTTENKPEKSKSKSPQPEKPASEPTPAPSSEDAVEKPESSPTDDSASAATETKEK